jgi:hypothetical protein
MIAGSGGCGEQRNAVVRFAIHSHPAACASELCANAECQGGRSLQKAGKKKDARLWRFRTREAQPGDRLGADLGAFRPSAAFATGAEAWLRFTAYWRQLGMKPGLPRDVPRRGKDFFRSVELRASRLR